MDQKLATLTEMLLVSHMILRTTTVRTAARERQTCKSGQAVDSANSFAYIANQAKECAMATRNVVLTETQSDLVDRLVASGRYQNASEALRAGLRLLEREEAELGALRDRLSTGIEQARSGELADGTGEDAVRRAFACARTTQ